MISAHTVLPALLDARAEISGDKVFLYNDDQDTTYREVADESRAVAAALVERGVGRGDRVALAMDNRREWIAAFFGLLRLGAIAVTINPLYRESELHYMLTSTRTKLVISEPASGDYDLVDFYANADLPHLKHRVFLTTDAVPVRDGIESYADFVAAGRAAPAIPEELTPAVDDPAVILFSSGTTGRSKGAVLTHRSVQASAEAQVASFSQTEDDVILGVMPLNHVGGITCTVVSSVLAGGGIEQMLRFNPVTVTERLLRGRVTMLVGVPTMYSMMLADPSLKEADLSAVRLCVIGGSNVEPATATAVMRLFTRARLANLYGLSETSGACIISPESDSKEQVLSTIGVAIGDFETRVVGPDGSVRPAGEDGELQIRGACVMAEYWELPEKTQETLGADGWLYTGDIAMRSSDGHVALRGRSKEMYIRGGYNVYPTEVENVIAQIDGVAMVAVVGIPSEKYGETGRAYVVLREGAVLDAHAVIAGCARQLAEYKVPDSVEFVSALPLTPSGKVKKADLG